jgi:hypothetical protein
VQADSAAKPGIGEQTMAQSLESTLGGVGNIVDFLRNQQVGPNVYPGVPGEFSNWRDDVTVTYDERTAARPGYELFGPW